MNLPKKLKIGGIVYSVEQKKDIDDGECAGKIHTDKQLIELSEGTPDYMKVTLIHEILHAINNEVKETDVEFYAQALYQVIKENPELFKEVK